LNIRTTNDAEPVREIIGQDRALRALRIGLEMSQHGYNIYVNGLSGTGRTTTVRRLLEEFEHGSAELTDKCFVHNFHDEDAPRLIVLPAGKGAGFQKDMGTLVAELRKGIPAVFDSRRYQEERKTLLEHFQERQRSVLRDFERRVKERGFDVVQIQAGPGVRPEIAPVLDGNPVTFEQLQAKVDGGEVTAEQSKRIQQEQSQLEAQMDLVMREMRNIERKAKAQLEQLNTRVVVPLVEELLDDLRTRYTGPVVEQYLLDVQKDILDNIARFHQKEEQPQASLLGMHVAREEDEFREYQVNVAVDNTGVTGRPVIIETNPKYNNLFGTIERVVDRHGVWRTDLTHIKAGSLIRADGGFLVINALDALVEPWVWTTLKRVLRNRQIEIQPAETGILGTTVGLKPEAIPINVKVIMIGDASIYHILYAWDDDFKKIFKIRADFDTEMPNAGKSVTGYVAFVKSICDGEKLPSFDAEAVAEVVELGARLAGRRTKLSTRFNLVAEMVREAGYWAARERTAVVGAAHVRKAVAERIERVRLVEEKIQEAILEGSLLIDTGGSAVGQVNGLSVYMMGDFEFGKPTRITAKTGLGKAGIINIERESDLSGPTHNKGVLILGGYFRWKYGRGKQLMFSSSLAFEQSYGGVDGDSASSTEVYALLSSFAELPLRQDLAVTGSINQHGEIQPIGGVNEKIEGFYDVCAARGLTGTQGVIIPRRNARDLMLRHDVVDAVRGGRFHVYAIDSVDQGIELLTGVPAGKPSRSGRYPAGTVHARVDRVLTRYARQLK
jgi:ATP-dependent Lon protease